MASGTTTAPASGLEEILLHARVYIEERSNATTAGDLTRNKERIEVSFCPARVPLPSRLYVHCPDLDPSFFSETPRILCMVDDLILIRVAIRCLEPRFILMEECDYFIYRVDLPSLKLLPHPHPARFQDDDVGLLPRGDHYTIAALLCTGNPTVFTLHLLHSEIGSWTSITVSLDAPQKEFPLESPCKASWFSDHWTSTVITLGGEGGTMGWVDLWRGILLCDVRNHGDMNLRFVPVPLPMALLNCNDGREVKLGCPEPYRGIAYIKEKGCLRFVDLEMRFTRLHSRDKETGYTSMKFDGWTIGTWRNFCMSGSRDDWKMDRQPVHAKNVNKSRKMHLQLRDALQREKSGAACLEMNLQNLCVSHPAPSVNGRNVVYLMTRAKFMDTKACVLAVDMEKMKLQHVVEFGTEREPVEDVFCHPVSISRSLMNQAASQGSNLGC